MKIFHKSQKFWKKLCRKFWRKYVFFQKFRNVWKKEWFNVRKYKLCSKVMLTTFVKVYFTYCFVSCDYHIDLLSIDKSNISAEVVAAWGEVSFEFFMFSLTSIGSRLTLL